MGRADESKSRVDLACCGTFGACPRPRRGRSVGAECIVKLERVDGVWSVGFGDVVLVGVQAEVASVPHEDAESNLVNSPGLNPIRRLVGFSCFGQGLDLITGKPLGENDKFVNRSNEVVRLLVAIIV